MAFVKNVLLVIFFPYFLTLGPPLFGVSVESFAVALDISKAFDRIWHKALIPKLPLSESILLSNFLSGRSIAAVVDGHSSCYKSTNIGAPWIGVTDL